MFCLQYTYIFPCWEKVPCMLCEGGGVQTSQLEMYIYLVPRIYWDLVPNARSGLREKTGCKYIYIIYDFMYLG